MFLSKTILTINAMMGMKNEWQLQTATTFVSIMCHVTIVSNVLALALALVRQDVTVAPSGFTLTYRK